MISGTAAPIPAPMPTLVQSRFEPEESEEVVVGAATMIEGMLAVSIPVFVSDCPVVESAPEDEEVDVEPDDEPNDDELDNDKLDMLEEVDDDPDVD